METGMLSLSIVPFIIFATAAILATVLGIVLAYHLFRYSTHAPVAYAATSIYFFVSGVLLICLFALALTL